MKFHFKKHIEIANYFLFLYICSISADPDLNDISIAESDTTLEEVILKGMLKAGP